MSLSHLKAISVLQPWAWLLSHNFKDVENRRWRTNYRGEVLIHAGKKWGPEQIADLNYVRLQFPEIELPEHFDRGGVVGKATLTDCIEHSTSPWFFGPFGFVMRDAVVLPFTPCKGALGFFSLPEGVHIEAPNVAPPPPPAPPEKEEPWGMIERRQNPDWA